MKRVNLPTILDLKITRYYLNMAYMFKCEDTIYHYQILNGFLIFLAENLFTLSFPLSSCTYLIADYIFKHSFSTFSFCYGPMQPYTIAPLSSSSIFIIYSSSVGIPSSIFICLIFSVS